MVTVSDSAAAAARKIIGSGRVFFMIALWANCFFAFARDSAPLMVAHRGAGDRTSFRPEASLAAYSNAVATACDVVKFDLQCTRDNVIVMGHCPNLKRTMGWDANIKELDYAEIYGKGRYLATQKKPGTQRIVRLDEAIAICRSIPQFWIDFKYFDPSFAENVFKTFADAGIDRKRLMVATFNVKALEYMKEKHPDIRRIRHTLWWQASKSRFRIHGEGKHFKTREEVMAHIVARSKELGLYGMNIPVERATPEDIALFRKGGAKWISLYFVQNADTAAKVRSWGADAFVTDYVTKARAGLNREKVADFDVKTYGAKGDGVTKDTVAIQKALDGCSLEFEEVARSGADCVKNGSFEVRGQENAWKLPEGWRISRGFGRNGGGGLVLETSEPIKERCWPEQIVDVEPGKIYDLSAWVDANLDTPRNISVVAQFLDAKGKMIASSRTIAHGPKKKWGKISARTKRTPDNAKRARIRLLVPSKATGKVCFDDISFTVFKVDPVTVLCSSCYRNEAVDGEPPVVFYAGVDLNDSNCTKDDTDIVFSFDTADGKRARRKASGFDGSDASVKVAVGELKMGEQEVCAEAIRRDGTVVGKRTMKFARLERRPKRPVWIDRNRRVMVNDKPFFPITMYCSQPQSNMIERIGKSPCNTIMAYGKLDWAMLDWCQANGLMACPYVGDLSTKDALVAKRMNKVKDHPAIFSWLMNDERPLAALPQLHSRYKTVTETDPGRPAWAVLYQVDDMRGYVGTCDAIGSDPYPLPHASVKLAHDWVEKTRKATFGALSLWQTIQVFDWAAYKTKGQFDPDVPKYRAPTLAEMKIMAWMQIAGGANALLMYSYNPVEKMDWRDPFEKKWKEICECAGEIAAVEDVILSVDEAPVPKDVPAGLSVRTWRKNGQAYLLVCNAVGKNLKTRLHLSQGFSGKMRMVFGGGVKREEDRLSVDFTPEGYAFLAFE